MNNEYANMNDAEKTFSQYKKMSEFIFNMNEEGSKLIEAFNNLREAFKYPNRDVERFGKEHKDLTDARIAEILEGLSEEAQDRVYQEAYNGDTVDNDRVDMAQGRINRMQREYEQYSQLLDYRKKVEAALNEFDNQLVIASDKLKELSLAPEILDIKAKRTKAEENRTPGNATEKAYADGLNDFVKCFDFYETLCAELRGQVADRKSGYDEGFNAEKEEVEKHNKEVNDKIAEIIAERKVLDEEIKQLDSDLVIFDELRDYDNPEYKELMERKIEKSRRRSELLSQEYETKKELKSLPSYNFDFNSYEMKQEDYTRLAYNLEKYIEKNGDLETQMNKHIVDAKTSSPRFEFLFDDEENLIVSCYINGKKLTKTVGKYDELNYDKISSMVRYITSRMAGASFELNDEICTKIKYQIATVTKDGLVFADTKDQDGFKMFDVSHYLYDVVKEKQLENDKLNNLRDVVNQEPDPVQPEPQPVQPEPTPVQPEPTPVQPEPGETEPEPEETEDEEIENTNENEVEHRQLPANALRIVSARDYDVKVGNDNDLTRRLNPGQNRTYEKLLKDRFARKFITPAIAAIGIFGIAAVPTLPVILAAGGTYAIANIMGHSSEIIEMARRHKLNKLAQKAGLSIGYNVDKYNYGMYFLDSEGRPLNAEEAQSIAGDRVNIQEELDKIAGNKYRSKDYREEFAAKAEKKFENRTIKKLAKYGAQFDLLLDEDYLKQTGNIRFTDLDGHLLTDEELEDQVDDIYDFKEDIADMTDEYKKGMREIQNDQYYGKLLVSGKAQRLNKMSDIDEVTPNNLIALFDDLGGLKLTKKKPNKISKWINSKLEGLREALSLEEPEEQLTNDINLDVQEVQDVVANDAPDVTDEVIAEDAPAEEVTDEPVVDAEAPAEEVTEENVEAPVAETPVEEAPVEAAPVEETPVAETPVAETPVVETVVNDEAIATPEVPVASEPINSEDLDINEAIVNATTTAAPVMDESEMEAERAATVQQAMAEDELEKQDISKNIQDYMEATIADVASTLPDLVATNPAEAEKFIINHPEHQALYDSIVQSLEPGSEGLGTK